VLGLNGSPRDRTCLAAIRILRATATFPRPYFQPGISVEQLAAQAATGPTGPTGATSDIVPPAALEPTPGPGS
jgi:hypothetical protein